VHPILFFFSLLTLGPERTISNDTNSCVRDQQSKSINDRHRCKWLLVLEKSRNEEDLRRHAFRCHHLLRGRQRLDSIVRAVIRAAS
jgi:hypothetical protein